MMRSILTLSLVSCLIAIVAVCVNDGLVWFFVFGRQSVLTNFCDNVQLLHGPICKTICSSDSHVEDNFIHASKDYVADIVMDGERYIWKYVNLSTKLPHIDDLLAEFDCSDLQYREILTNLVTADTSVVAMDNMTTEQVHGVMWPWWPLSDDCLDRRQVLRLAHLDEYRMLMVYSDRHLFPRVLGTCGDSYLMERLDVPLQDWRKQLVPGLLDCSELTFLVEIFDYIQLIGGESGLYLCDFKWSHFGRLSANVGGEIRSDSGPVRFLDLDSVLSGERLRHTQSMTSCNNDVDCDVFDCRGRCSLSRGICEPYVLGNVAILCAKLLFPDWHVLGWQAPFGMLWHDSCASDIDVLRVCASGNDSHGYQAVRNVLVKKQQAVCL